MFDALGFDAISGGLISEALNLNEWMRERGIVAGALAVLFPHWVMYKKRVSGIWERKTLHIWMHNCVKCRFQQTLKHTHTDNAQMSCTKCRRTVPEGASFCNTLLSRQTEMPLKEQVSQSWCWWMADWNKHLGRSGLSVWHASSVLIANLIVSRQTFTDVWSILHSKSIINH